MHKYLKILLCFYGLLFSYFTRAQINLVPNNSFEVIDTCPTPIYGSSPSQFSKYWFDIKNTPDYFTNCPGVNPAYQPPSNSFGYQCPANGGSYMGIYSFAKINPGVQEVFSSRLNDSLIKNIKYYISFKAVLANINGVSAYYATSKLGIKFFTKLPNHITTFTTSTDKYVNNFAHFYTNQIITDTLNWSKIKGSFISDSNYKYVAVGNFFSYINSDTTQINSGGGWAYYFIDDVCVSSDSNTCNIPNQTVCMSTAIHEISAEKFIYLAPNPCKEFFYVMGINETIPFKIYNSIGKTVKQGFLKEKEEIIINDLPPSVYFIELKNQNILITKKIIINP